MAAHWSERYVGIPFVEGAFDCGDLAERVQREVFGRDVVLPSERGYAGKNGRAKFAAMGAQILAELDRYVRPVERPEDGDLALLLCNRQPWHIGTYCAVAGEGWVLHMADSFKASVCVRVRELARHAMAVEGYYRWT